MGRRFRKRSATITLVLAGSLSGCGSEPIPQQDAYRNLNDCVRDWGNAAQCQPVRDGRYASSYYYGPSHFGNRYTDGRPKPSPNAMDSVARPKGTQVSSLTARSGSPGSAGSPSSSSSSGSTARGGFGSSSSAHSSGG